MNDLFKKLNVLLKSGVHSVGQAGEPRSERLSQPPIMAGGSLEKEVVALRERINEAVRYEEELAQRVRQYEQEAARWDRQADDAVAQGSDASARYAIEQMRRAEQRAVMAESDLRAHQQATQDLIQRVNTLEAVVADTLRAQAAQVAEQPAEETPAINLPENLHLPDLSNVLREAREKILSLGELAAAQQELDAAGQPEDGSDVGIDDDLEARRQRLSKP